MHTKLTIAAIFLIGMCACQKSGQDTTNTDSLGQTNVGRDSSHGMTKPSGTMDHAAMVQQMNSMDEMMVKDLGAADSEYDRRFIDLMIPHHEGAIMMAKDA